MTSEGLWKIFKGDSADMCAGKFTLVSMGAGQRISCAQGWEQRPSIGAIGNTFGFMHIQFVVYEPKAE
jgi:hypothetical protein